MKVVVEILEGARAGRRLEFEEPTVIRLGRHPDCEVVFDADRDLDVSARHAELRRDGSRLLLADLGSANGTHVNHRRVGAPQPLASGAELELGRGGPRVRVVYDGEGAPIPHTVRRADGGTRVGSRTVAFMIDQALGRVREGHRRTRLLAAGLGVGLVASVAASALRPRSADEAALRREIVRLMEQQREAAAPRRAELGAQLTLLSRELTAAQGQASRRTGAEIAREARDLVYLLAVKHGLEEQGLCTAFAVQPTRLATNAHCVALAEDQRRRGGALFVVQNGREGARLQVTRTRRSPGFRPGGISADVGWIEVSGPLARVAPLAPAEEQRALATGDPIYTLGFPGRLTDVRAPEATFVEGVVGRITTLDGRAGVPAELRLIQHSAFTASGTSGSPIFNARGHVVAINTGGYLEESSGGPRGEPVVSRSLPGYNFGMRVDMVEELLSEAER